MVLKLLILNTVKRMFAFELSDIVTQINQLSFHSLLYCIMMLILPYKSYQRSRMGAKCFYTKIE
jgi:hypothetical protein